jgi:IS5 family transposase
VKVGLAITSRQGLIVGARSFPRAPYDGDTLDEQLERAEILMGHKPKAAIVDLGYRGREVEGVQSLRRGKSKRLIRRQSAWVKRRQAIESIIGHVKDDCAMRRGAQGYALHAIAGAAGYNLRWIALFVRD